MTDLSKEEEQVGRCPVRSTSEGHAGANHLAEQEADVKGGDCDFSKSSVSEESLTSICAIFARVEGVNCARSESVNVCFSLAESCVLRCCSSALPHVEHFISATLILWVLSSFLSPNPLAPHHRYRPSRSRLFHNSAVATRASTQLLSSFCCFPPAVSGSGDRLLYFRTSSTPPATAS